MVVGSLLIMLLLLLSSSSLETEKEGREGHMTFGLTRASPAPPLDTLWSTIMLTNERIHQFRKKEVFHSTI